MPKASQQSSINQRLYFLQSAVTTSRLKGLPSECANIIALVFGPIATSILLASMLWVLGSTSTKTGTAPNCKIGLTVVGKPAATPITSSPGLIALSPSLGDVSVLKATRLADEPELTVIKCLTPIKEASFSSNSALNRPVVNQPSKEASTIALSSSTPSTLPDGGTTWAPGIKSGVLNLLIEKFSTLKAVTLRNTSSSFVLLRLATLRQILLCTVITLSTRMTLLCFKVPSIKSVAEIVTAEVLKA